MTPQEWLDLIVDRAPALRLAGVSSFSVDGVSVEMLPMYPGEQTSGAAGEIPSGRTVQLLDPMDDPDTFGGVLPGYDIPASPPGSVE